MAPTSNILIRRTLERPHPELVAKFRGMPTGWIADANGRRGGLAHTIAPVFAPHPFVGTALTVWTVPNDNLVPYVAISHGKPGDVLVVAVEGAQSSSVAGDVLLGMARNAGIVAFVTDGMVRDIDGIEQVGIPVFARGLSINSPGKNGPGRIGWPLALGGVTIETGDLVAGDRNGVVVVRRAEISKVLTELEEVGVKERAMDAVVAAGATQPTWLADYLARHPIALAD